MLYPLLMQPHFRHGIQTPWGGDSLALLGKSIPDALTGESCEISALAGMSSTVQNGPLAGASLCDIAGQYGSALSGSEGTFPLLVKLIDARERLSVQVHPGDDYAMQRHGKLGKTEAWLVLSCQPGASLYCGLVEGVTDFAAISRDEQAVQAVVRQVSVQPGDVFYIPHGLVHAIGAGILLYEIQQSSDVTYRVSDWGRMGADGKPRQLHIDDAAAVVRPTLSSQKLPGASLVVDGGVMTAYVCDENFALWRLLVSGDMPLSGGKMRLITVLGDCAIAWGSVRIDLTTGSSVLVPAECEDVHLLGRVHAIMSTLSDKQSLRNLLGTRAANVAGLTD